jgi:glycosyltransferase involved in cell wall biosynthesis
MSAVKILFAVNSVWNLVNFRAGLIRALVQAGYEVVAVAPPDEHVSRLVALGCRYIEMPMDNRGTHPVRDALLLIRLIRVLRTERPGAMLGYTIKPNIYGSLACHVLGIPTINNISGLGAVFISRGWVTHLVQFLYRQALARSAHVFFQNSDDEAHFLSRGLAPAGRTGLLPGSGVDLVRFAPVFRFAAMARTAPVLAERDSQPGPSHQQSSRAFRFLLIARMLWDKGVGEYVDAARALRKVHPEVEFALLGFLDVKNPAAISRDQMNAWVDEGVVKYLGSTDDPRPFIADADCVVLPSYREGTPRSLLEAAAMARPIVTTDVEGCREVVDDGINGLLCQVRSDADLANKMARMLSFSAEEREQMGRAGRAKMERQFDEQIVIDRYLSALERVCSKIARSGI